MCVEVAILAGCEPLDVFMGIIETMGRLASRMVQNGVATSEQIKADMVDLHAFQANYGKPSDVIGRGFAASWVKVLVGQIAELTRLAHLPADSSQPN